ncbi:MAG: hypothetical protein KKD44_19160 [Proteobacteria bacterium]|nr:hypothetical protein [Pseudomonadota bacterium]
MTFISTHIKMTCLCLIVLMFTSHRFPAMAGEVKAIRVIRVLGTGDIYNEDTSSAKDKAISNALVSALGAVLIEDIPNKIVIANFQAVNTMIHASTDSFIQGYKVLAEARMGKKYKVMIEATVSTAKIRSSLVQSGIVLDPANKYKILLLISENNLEDLAPQFWWGKGKSYVKTISDSTISQVMRNKGFEVIKHRLIHKELMKTQMDENNLSDVLSRDLALAIGRSFEADIIITGSATAEQALNTMGEDRAYTGSLSLAIYKTDSGERIGSVIQKAVKVNTDEATGSREALSEAAGLAGNDLAATINMAMKVEENKPTMIEVEIEGTDFFINYTKLSQKISTLPGVKRVKQREKQKASAIIIIDFIGNGKSLAKALMAETFENFGLNISEVSRNHLRLEMVPLSSNIFVR